uniref:Putative Sec34-domain-containing protein n=1 Tax=Moniliophthora roreri TaxID=221103 RepID=A0A0W0EWI1_MONRR
MQRQVFKQFFVTGDDQLYTLKRFATTLTTSFDLEFFTNQGLLRSAKFAQF